MLLGTLRLLALPWVSHDSISLDTFGRVCSKLE
jgi:hypothetical protein